MRVDTPGTSGYGWRMEDSERLRNEVARRAAQKPKSTPRLPGDALGKLVLGLAAAHGVDPDNLRYATDEELAAKERETHREREIRQAEIMTARIPLLYREATLPAIPAGAMAAKWLHQYRNGVRNPLAILGPTGTGKTWVALALARSLLVEDSTPVMFITAPDLLAELRPSGVIEHAGLELAQFKTTPILVIDDLGTEKLTTWGEEQFYRLANARAADRLPMIVTSNNTGPELRARYGDRIIGRMFGGATLIVMDGPDRRALPDGF